MKERVTLKAALALTRMDECVLPHRSPSRAWWRYGWAYGYILRNVHDAMAPVRERRYRVAIKMGHVLGAKARLEAESVGPGG